MADNSATQERKPPVFGVDAEFMSDLETLSVDPTTFTLGAFSDIQFTIIGLEQSKGGDKKVGRDGKEFVTQDQLVINFRIDNADELGIEDPYTRQWLPLPRLIEKDGVRRRADPGVNNDYGRWITKLEDLGISAQDSLATKHKMRNFLDLIGLRGRRQAFALEARTGQEPRFVNLPSEVYASDDEIRQQAGLDPLFFADDPARNAGTTAPNGRRATAAATA